MHVAERRAKAPVATWVLLHPLPFCAKFFNRFAEIVPADVQVLMPDYPGFGGSDPLDGLFTIEAVAKAQAPLAEISEAPIKLIGFHTGCLVAAECSIKQSLAVADLVLIDIPHFGGEKRERFIESTDGSIWPPVDAESISTLFNSDFGKRAEVLGVDRAFEFFVSHLNATTDPQQAFRAAFEYDVAARFSLINIPTRVVATDSSLRDGTLEAGALIPGATIKDVAKIKNPVFEHYHKELLAVISNT